ncbi:hypothetical protein BDR04DRAFT_1016840, partial [Suillus decipiens]
LPLPMVNFTEQVLTGQKTQLHFDGYTSDWIDINNGIGQGDPLSMILYIIYSTDLVDIVKPYDMALVAIGKDFTNTHRILKDMLEHPGGGFNWLWDHNSRFETNKFALINFFMNRKQA